MDEQGQGVLQDYVKAYAWLSLTAVQRRKVWAGQHRVQLESKMNPHQLSQAHRMLPIFQRRLNSRNASKARNRSNHPQRRAGRPTAGLHPYSTRNSVANEREVKKMRHLLWLCCVCTLLPDAAQATSFTAPSNRDPAYYTNGYADPLTVTVEPGSEDAVITVPEATVDGSPWPVQAVAVLFYSAGAWYADCNHRALGARTDDAGVQWWGGQLLGYCMGELAVTMLGNGRAEIRVPKEWFLEATKLVYGIYKRYETCLATGGEKDIWFPSQRCPPVGSGRGDRNQVARPWTALRIQLQWDSSGNANAEYFFYSASYVHDPHIHHRAAPGPVHLGELEKIYAWIESTEEPAPDVPKVSQILTHVFAGPLANATAETEITITNRTAEPCAASVRFHRGTEDAPQVRFNGQHLDENRTDIDIGGGAVQRIVLTADPGQDLAVGAVYVEQATGCAAGALQLEGRYLITSQDGQIMEAFSVLPQTENDWLSDGDCRLLSNSFGGQDNIGLAMVTARTGDAAPSGTRMTFEAFDWQGNFVEEPPSLEVTGEQQALNPWKFDEPRLIKLCLDVPDDQQTNFRLSLISIAARVSSRNVQYSSSALIRP